MKRNFKLDKTYTFYVACNPLEEIKLKRENVCESDTNTFSLARWSSNFLEKYDDHMHDFICFDKLGNYYHAYFLTHCLYELEEIILDE